MVDFAISLVLVPTLLTFVPGRHRAAAARALAAWSRCGAWRGSPTRRPGLVLGVAALVLSLVSIGGILRLRVDTNHINFFWPAIRCTQSARLIDRKLSGIYGFQVFFEGPADSMRDPAMLARIDRAAAGDRRAAERAQGRVAGRLRQARSTAS